MGAWESLTEGLVIQSLEGVVPPELVERLDLVYCLDERGHSEPGCLSGVDLQHSVQDVGGVVTDVRKILTPSSSSVKVIISNGGHIGYHHERTEVVRPMRREGSTLDQLSIFAVVLEPFGDFVATPVFCLGERPTGEDMGDLGYTRYHGLYPVGMPAGFIRIDQGRWEGQIDVRPEGRASVYFGNACIPSEGEAVMFDKLVPFDLEKRLVLARSPNGSQTLEALHKMELEEGNRTFEYSLVYANVKAMREGKTWAVHTPPQMKWKNNPYLRIQTQRRT